MIDPEMKRIFAQAMSMVLISKALTIASPVCLKFVIDSMTLSSQLSVGTAFVGIAAFCGSRFIAEASKNINSYLVSDMITRGVRKLSYSSFTHLHSLDMNYHKTSSKNTVFAINRALRSVESGMRFILAFFTPIAVEFTFLCGMLGLYCGPQYLVNMCLMVFFYTYFSKSISERRRVEMRAKKNSEKNSEFYLNESIMNYEAVKTYNNEKMENDRYSKLIDKFRFASLDVQKSLGLLNVG